MADITTRLASQGISSWDFAYPTGDCTLSSDKDCCPPDFKSQCRKARAELKSKNREHFIAEHIAALSEKKDLAPTAETKECAEWRLSLSKGKKSSSKHSKSKSKSKTGSADPKCEPRTYLLSSPTASSIYYPQTHTTIATLLMTPRTQLIYLVPQSRIVCPKVCDLMRLPRAGGSSIQILPVSPDIEMCSHGQVCDVLDQLGVEEVVKKVLKNTRARAFDGYVTFEDDRSAWAFLEHVGREVKSASTKKG